MGQQTVRCAHASTVGGGTTEEMIATVIIMFLVFLPLFAYGALSEVLGEKALFRILFVKRMEFEVADRSENRLDTP